ncbi:MAG: aminotransferase class I/II-fold pyridoxal phosphate-dependent enzyme [Actinomycetota bacterium]|nr:aminotransferase class I/II-fold pyridoxal phosphate-dependent enzyme [Actinomycetota bacterium]
MRPPILLSPPDLRGGEREAVLAAFDSGWIAPVGPDLDAFERELAATCGTSHAVGLSSGTAGLHLALHALGVGPGDDVLVATFTFVATANAVCYTGARPVFVDCEPSSWCVDPDLLLTELDARRRRATLPKAIVTVDLYGQCADHDRFVDTCRELGVAVIEDAAEAIGATYHGRPAGSLGDIGVLSFNGNKLITTSGGGAVVVDGEEQARRIRYLATQARQPVEHYEHTELGFNYRLSNLLAALGRAQLATLDARIADRHATRAWYAQQFAGVAGVALIPDAPDQLPNHWLTCVTVDAEEAGFSAADVRATLAAAGIESRPLWKPMHLQPQFAGAAAIGGTVSADLFARGVTLPSNPNQPDFHERVGTALADLLTRQRGTPGP